MFHPTPVTPFAELHPRRRSGAVPGCSGLLLLDKKVFEFIYGCSVSASEGQGGDETNLGARARLQRGVQWGAGCQNPAGRLDPTCMGRAGCSCPPCPVAGARGPKILPLPPTRAQGLCGALPRREAGSGFLGVMVGWFFFWKGASWLLGSWGMGKVQHPACSRCWAGLAAACGPCRLPDVGRQRAEPVQRQLLMCGAAPAPCGSGYGGAPAGASHRLAVVLQALCILHGPCPWVSPSQDGS